MKQNIAYDELKFEQENVLDEACTIYPDLLEVRKKLPNIYKDFEKMYQKCVINLMLSVLLLKMLAI
jgi:hypothetical protein